MSNIIISGTGLISTNIFEYLKDKHNFYFLTTSKEKANANANHYYWNPTQNIAPSIDYKDIDVVINTAGHTINCRWTKNNKKK